MKNEAGICFQNGDIYSECVWWVNHSPDAFLICKGKTKGKTPLQEHKKNPVTIAVTGFLVGGDTRI